MTRNCIWMGVFSQVVTLPWSGRLGHARIRQWTVRVAGLCRPDLRMEPDKAARAGRDPNLVRAMRYGYRKRVWRKGAVSTSINSHHTRWVSGVPDGCWTAG